MNGKLDVVVLTDHRYLKDSDDLYGHNVYYEDQLVVEALRSLDLKVNRKAWDDKSFDWSSTRSVIFRSTWDYFDRFSEFSDWLDQVSELTLLINSKDLIYWNLDKHYLIDMKSKGIPVAESFFIEINSQKTLKELHEKLGWHETVLKPCISGAARHTYKIQSNTIKELESVYKSLIRKEAMILQPFQHRIVTEGEISMMLMGGKFTHAVLKIAKPGDFRVQDDFGGTVHNYTPSQNEIHFAENAVKACPEIPIYARVDIFKDNNDELAVSELELVEPELWFRHFPKAAQILANAIKKKLEILNLEI